MVVLLMSLLAGGEDLESQPFLHMSRRSQVYVQADSYVQSLLSDMSRSRGSWNHVRPEDVLPKAHVNLANHPLRKVWVNREGVFLYYEGGAHPRHLPSDIPFVTGLQITLPHRAVWYCVLPKGVSFADWVDEYSSQYAKWKVARHESVCRVKFVDERRARLEISRSAWASPDDFPREVLDKLPRQADGYYVAPDRLDGTAVTGYVKLENGVVFRAAFPELFELDLETLAREVRARQSDYSVTLLPEGIPRKFRDDFKAAVQSAAGLSLQRADGETLEEFRRRTMLGAWQLDLLSLLLTDLKYARIAIDGLVDDGQLRLSFRMRTKTGVASRLLGQARRSPKSRLRLVEAMPSWCTAYYNGQLPAALTTAIAAVARDSEDSSLTKALSTVGSSPNQELVLKVGAANPADEDSSCVVWGAVATPHASSVVTEFVDFGAESTGRAAVLYQETPPGNQPKYVGFAATPEVLFFAASDEDVARKLNELSGLSVASAPRRTSKFMNLDVDLHKLSNSAVDTGFSAAPLRMVMTIERLLSMFGKSVSMGGFDKIAEQEKTLSDFESSGIVADNSKAHDMYFSMLGRYLKLSDTRLDPKRDSLRHWLSPKSGGLKVSVQLTQDELRVEGVLGRSVYHWFLGQFNRGKVTVGKSLWRRLWRP